MYVIDVRYLERAHEHLIPRYFVNHSEAALMFSSGSGIVWSFFPHIVTFPVSSIVSSTPLAIVSVRGSISFASSVSVLFSRSILGWTKHSAGTFGWVRGSPSGPRTAHSRSYRSVPVLVISHESTSNGLHSFTGYRNMRDTDNAIRTTGKKRKEMC